MFYEKNCKMRGFCDKISILLCIKHNTYLFNLIFELSDIVACFVGNVW